MKYSDEEIDKNLLRWLVVKAFSEAHKLDPKELGLAQFVLEQAVLPYWPRTWSSRPLPTFEDVKAVMDDLVEEGYLERVDGFPYFGYREKA